MAFLDALFSDDFNLQETLCAEAEAAAQAVLAPPGAPLVEVRAVARMAAGPADVSQADRKDISLMK